MNDVIRTADERFEVGEIAIMVGLKLWPEWNNQECEIIGGLEMREFWTDRGHTRVTREVRYRGAVQGITMCIRPENLRKKRAPREPLGDWELIPWSRPTKEKANG